MTSALGVRITLRYYGKRSPQRLFLEVSGLLLLHRFPQ